MEEICTRYFENTEVTLFYKVGVNKTTRYLTFNGVTKLINKTIENIFFYADTLDEIVYYLN